MNLQLGIVINALILIGRSFAAISELRRPPIWRVLQRQLFFSGVESMLVACAIGAALGLILVAQMNSLLGRNAFLSAKLLSFVLLRELGPLFTAIVLIARSGSAMASELASMKVSGEIRQLELGMGIPVLHYLLLPRIVGAMLSAICLSFYLQCGGILAGVGAVMVSGYNQDLPPILQVMPLVDIVWSLGKSAIFGLWIGAVTCACGMRVGRSMTEIPQAASRAVITAIVSVFALDGVLALLMTAGEAHG